MTDTEECHSTTRDEAMSWDEEPIVGGDDRLTRTEFATRAVKLGAGLSLAGAFAGRLSSEAQGASRGQQAPAKSIVFSMEANPPGFDPQRWWSNEAFSGTVLVFDRLMKIDPYTGAVSPGLAAAAPKVTRKGTRYTFKLRKGVKFHHGRELTSDDVKFTIERLVTPSTAAEAGTLYNILPILGMRDVVNEKTTTLKGVQAVDRYTVVIDLEQPDSTLVPFLTYLPASIVPRDAVTEMGAAKFNWTPIGTGVYRMTNIQPGKGVELLRWGPYWGTPPKTPRVVWSIGVNPDLALLRIRSGEQDLMFEQVPSASLPDLRNDPKLKNQLFSTTVNAVRYIGLSQKHPALQNLKVRQAIAYAINKGRIVALIRGQGYIATGGLFAPPNPLYTKGLAYPYNPSKAKQLLSDAGFADGFEIEIASNGRTPQAEIAAGVQQDLNAIGIRVKIRTVQTRGADAAYNNFGPLISQNGWDAPVPTGAYLMDAAFTQNAIDQGCCNYANFTSPTMENLVRKAHLGSDQQAAQLYKQMDKYIVKDQAIWVPIYYRKQSDFVSARVKGYKQVNYPNIALHMFNDISVA